jgi:hypothetical protein
MMKEREEMKKLSASQWKCFVREVKSSVHSSFVIVKRGRLGLLHEFGTMSEEK